MCYMLKPAENNECLLWHSKRGNIYGIRILLNCCVSYILYASAGIFVTKIMNGNNIIFAGIKYHVVKVIKGWKYAAFISS